MPAGNCFRHQAYSDASPGVPVELLRAAGPADTDSAEFRRQMQQVGCVFRQAGVTAIYLVHGSFVGMDGTGFLREVARLSPAVARQLRQLHKQTVDRVTQEAGNYTPAFASLFEDALQMPGARRIPVRLFHWSSENHHLGRADGAVRLLDALASSTPRRGDRLLIWGHSHGGNLLALVSNLLGNDAKTNHRFFRAARSFYGRRWGHADPVWSGVEQALLHREPAERPWSGVALDLVTFGTPVRYGWDRGGYAQLLHFVHHQPVAGLPPHRGAFPPSLDNLRGSAGGDLIQQLGIAGTNFSPPVWSWRLWLAEIRLGRLLQSRIDKRELLVRMKYGQRVHDEGQTLLVDYGPSEGHIGQHLFGHAVYTRRRWLPFHAAQVARRLYGAEQETDNMAGSDRVRASPKVAKRNADGPTDDSEETHE